MLTDLTDNPRRYAGVVDTALWVLVVLWTGALAGVVALLFGGTP